jgi:hypothetical protein
MPKQIFQKLLIRTQIVHVMPNTKNSHTNIEKKFQQSISKTYVTGSDKIALKESPDSLENAETSFLPLNPQPFSTHISFPPEPDPPVPCKYCE